MRIAPSILGLAFAMMLSVAQFRTFAGVPSQSIGHIGAASESPDDRPIVYLNISFEMDSATILSSGLQPLDSVADAIKSPELRPYYFEIVGHTDAEEGLGYSLELSLLRSGRIMEYLVRLGVDRTRLIPIGIGSLKPQVPGSSPQNARVEIINAGCTGCAD